MSRRTSYAGEYIWTGDAMTGCRYICEDCGIAKEAWQIGTTKVFIRHPETVHFFFFLSFLFCFRLLKKKNFFLFWQIWALEHLRERYWHNMAMRIQRAYRNYVRYKHESATRIQRCFRAWNMTKIFLQVRDYGHQVLGGRKERRRFSLLSMRRFMGDYLEFRSNSVLQNACGPGTVSEGIVFTSKIQVLIHRTLKADKFSPRFLVMTRKAVYIIVTKVEKNLAVTELERKIPLSSIQGVGLSPNMDETAILFVPSEYDTVLTCMFKTEFVTHLAWQTGGNVSINIAPSIEYNKKPGKKAKLSFAKDEMQTRELIIKKGVVTIASGRAASSISDPPCRRNEPPPKPITAGRLLKKGGPTASAPKAAGPPKAAAAPKAAAVTSAAAPRAAAAAPTGAPVLKAAPVVQRGPATPLANIASESFILLFYLAFFEFFSTPPLIFQRAPQVQGQLSLRETRSW